MEKNYKFLVVDDDPRNIKLINQALRYEDFELFSTTNPDEGIAIFEAEKPSLVLLDLKMPKMNGLEFLEKINLVPDVIFATIILTGYGDHFDIDRCFKLGASAFLRKPVDVKELRGLARNLFEAQNNKRELIEYKDVLEEMVKNKTDELVAEITKRKLKQLELEKSREEILQKNDELQHKNIAMSQILSRYEADKNAYRRRLLNHINLVIVPLIERLDSKTSRKIIDMINKEIDALPTLNFDLDSRLASLSKREIEICQLIRKNLNSKQIAEQLGVSLETIYGHRKQIRKKLNIDRDNVSLADYLKELT